MIITVKLKLKILLNSGVLDVEICLRLFLKHFLVLIVHFFVNKTWVVGTLVHILHLFKALQLR